MVYITKHTCKACGESYEHPSYPSHSHSSTSYCETCNAPTLVVVGFDGNRYGQPAVFTQAHKAANAFFAEHGISADMIKFPPVVTHVGYVFDGYDAETYTVTYHLEVPAYVAAQIEKGRDAA